MQHLWLLVAWGLSGIVTRSHAQITSASVLVLPSPVIDSVTYQCNGSAPVRVFVSNQISPCMYSIQSTVPQIASIPENDTGVFSVSGITDAVFRVHNGACYTDMAVHFDCNGDPLPLMLQTFSVRLYQDHQALLHWMVLEAQDIDRYEIEASGDGRSFHYLATVRATPGSGLKTYTYTDNRLVQGYNFYRIRLVGTDGSVRYSVVRFIVYSRDGGVIWYPNPASTYLYLELYNDREAPALDVRIYNSISGSQQDTRSYTLHAGLNKLAIDVRPLPDGVYYLQYDYRASDPGQGTIRFQKLSP